MPEGEWALTSVRAVGGELLTVHLVDAQPRVSRFALDGTQIGTVDVSGGSVTALNGDVDDEEVFLGLSTVTERVASHRLDLDDRRATRRHRPGAGR